MRPLRLPEALTPSLTAGDEPPVRRVTARMVDEATAVLAVSGEFDAAAYEPVAAALRELEAQRPRAITIDLLDLEFMDCAALRLLCEAAERAEEAGWALTIICPRPPADRVLTLCDGLPQALDIRRRDPRGAGSTEVPG